MQPEERRALIEDVFTDKGLNLSVARLCIGSSDYSPEIYSYDDVEGDTELSHFSVARDEKYVIPMIKEILSVRPDLYLFASPWSPPTWMKYPPVYNYGHLIQTEENLRAYALYFKKYVEAYAEEGIEIAQIHVQNEIHADQKFPSCVWNDGASLGNFMVNYLAPALEGKAEVWFGTVNGPEKQTATRHRQFLAVFDRNYARDETACACVGDGADPHARLVPLKPVVFLVRTDREVRAAGAERHIEREERTRRERRSKRGEFFHGFLHGRFSPCPARRQISRRSSSFATISPLVLSDSTEILSIVSDGVCQ
jgi:hypothetical protein